MRELGGKTAFVTGGASGIGFALCRAFLEQGMKVMLADIETVAWDRAVKALQSVGGDVQGVSCDVADPASVERAAKVAYEASEKSMSFATMPGWVPLETSTLFRSTVGDGYSTSMSWEW